MNDNDSKLAYEEKRDQLIAEALLRITVLENLLVSNGLLKERDVVDAYAKAVEDMKTVMLEAISGAMKVNDNAQ